MCYNTSMTTYWFRPKRFGYGFVPVTWEGWAATFLMIGLLFLAAYVDGILTVQSEVVTMQQGFRFLLDVFFIASISCYFFEKKMKEELRWRWWNRD